MMGGLGAKMAVGLKEDINDQKKNAVNTIFNM